MFVFGSINMDVITTCERHPAIGETVLGTSVSFHPGGKGANQAIAAARCLGECTLFGSVGADDFGGQMLAFLKENGVDTTNVAIASGSSTGVALITVDQRGDNTIVVTPGANELAKAPRSFDAVSGRPVVLAQLESPIDEIARLFAEAQAAGGTTILNPSPYRSLPAELLQSTSIVILNAHEFRQLTGRQPAANLQEVTAQLSSADLPLPCCVVITLGQAGAIVAERGRAPIRVAGHKVEPLNTTGVGDCFAGWFAAELAQGRTLEDAARRANAAAAISVTRAGAGPSMPKKTEVETFLCG